MKKLTPKQAYERYQSGRTCSVEQLKLALDWYIKTNPYKEFTETARRHSHESLLFAIKCQEEKEKEECPHFKTP